MTNLRDVLLELRGALPIYMHYKYSVLPIQGIDKGQFFRARFFSKQKYLIQILIIFYLVFFMLYIYICKL